MSNQANDVINIFRTLEYQAGETVLSTLEDDEEISDDEFKRRRDLLIGEALSISAEELQSSVYARIDAGDPIEESTSLKISSNRHVLAAVVNYAADDVRALVVSRLRPGSGIIMSLLTILAILAVSVAVGLSAAKAYLTSDQE